MPSTASETFYDLAVRALEEQEREVSGLRARTGTLAAGAAVVATLLASEVFKESHPSGWLEWTSAGVAVAGLVLVLGATVYLLRSHELTFSVDAAALSEYAGRTTDLDGQIEQLQLGIVYGLSSIQAANGPAVRRLRSAVTFALGGLVAETIGLGLGTALA